MWGRSRLPGLLGSLYRVPQRSWFQRVRARETEKVSGDTGPAGEVEAEDEEFGVILGYTQPPGRTLSRRSQSYPRQLSATSQLLCKQDAGTGWLRQSDARHTEQSRATLDRPGPHCTVPGTLDSPGAYWTVMGHTGPSRSTLDSPGHTGQSQGTLEYYSAVKRAWPAASGRCRHAR